MIMTKRELVKLNLILNQVKDLDGTKFKYTILRNIDLLKPQIKALKSIEDDYKKILSKFEEGRNNLILRLGTKQSDGSISVSPESEEFEEFKEEYEKLVEENKESIDTYNAQILEFEKLLNEEPAEEVTFRKISIDLCPEKGLSSENLDNLLSCGIIID